MGGKLSDKDAQAAVGNLMIKQAAKEIARDMGAGTTEAQREIGMFLDELVKAGQRVTMEIAKRNRGSYEFLTVVDDVDPIYLRQRGLNAIVQAEYPDGGNYRVTLKAQGVADREAFINIAPDPARRAVLAQAAAQGIIPAAPAAQAVQSPFYPATPWGGMGMSPFGGLAAGGLFQTPQERMMDKMFDRLDKAQQTTGPSETEKALRAEIEELRRQRMEDREERRIEEQRRRDEETRRQFDEAQKENNRRFDEVMKMVKETAEKAAAPKENTTIEILKLGMPMIGAAATSVVTMLAGRSDQAATHTREIMGLMKDQADKNLIMLQNSMNRPSVEDRMIKTVEPMMNFMQSSVQMFGAMASALGGGQQGDDWKVSLAKQAIDAVKDFGIAFVAGMPTKDEEQGDVPRLTDGGMPDGAEAAAAAAHQIDDGGSMAGLSDLSGQDEEQGEIIDAEVAEPGDDSGEEPEDGTKEMDPALVKIFEIIADPKGNIHEAAWRIYRNAKSGVEATVQWMNNHEPFTRDTLRSMRAAGRIDVTDERIEALVASIADLKTWLEGEGHTPDEWASAHMIPVKKRR